MLDSINELVKLFWMKKKHLSNSIDCICNCLVEGITTQSNIKILHHQTLVVWYLAMSMIYSWNEMSSLKVALVHYNEYTNCTQILCHLNTHFYFPWGEDGFCYDTRLNENYCSPSRKIWHIKMHTYCAYIIQFRI